MKEYKDFEIVLLGFGSLFILLLIGLLIVLGLLSLFVFILRSF